MANVGGRGGGAGAGGRVRLMVVVGYLTAVNLGAAYLFYHDKQCAIRHQWRVRESTLQLSALAGGWVGGILAMQTFRHKTSKSSFQVPYYAATVANMGLLAFLARTRQGRRMVDQFFQSLRIPAGSAPAPSSAPFATSRGTSNASSNPPGGPNRQQPYRTNRRR